jgi:hypothetical protein
MIARRKFNIKKKTRALKLKTYIAKKTVGMIELRGLFPSWKVKSIKKFIENYGSIDSMHPPSHRITSEEHMLDGIESRVACLLGKPKLTALQRQCGETKTKAHKNITGATNQRDQNQTKAKETNCSDRVV